VGSAEQLDLWGVKLDGFGIGRRESRGETPRGTGDTQVETVGVARGNGTDSHEEVNLVVGSDSKGNVPEGGMLEGAQTT
jgi:hypothetical protein